MPPHRHPKNIEFYSIWQKSTLKICVCAKFVVNLHPILKCGVSTSVVHRLPKPRRRVRFPYTAPEPKNKKGETPKGEIADRSIAEKGKKGVRPLISLSEESPGSTEHHSG